MKVRINSCGVKNTCADPPVSRVLQDKYISKYNMDCTDNIFTQIAGKAFNFYGVSFLNYINHIIIMLGLFFI